MSTTKRFLGLIGLIAGLASFAFASGPAAAPEISPASSAGAIALLSGALLVIRGRRKR
jgi:hypothetical protein